MPGKRTTWKQYRVLAITWTMAAAAMAVAVVRRLPKLSLPLVCLLLLSLLTASNFWKCCRRARDGDVPGPTGSAPQFPGHSMQFDKPPSFGSELFADDDPPLTREPNNDSEENDHE